MEENSLRQGTFFGINAGVLTTAGMLSGISQSTNNPMIIIVSIISLAISDSISEGYSLYLSKKAEKIEDNTNGPIQSLLTLISTKILVVFSFLIPLLFSYNLKYYKNLIWPIVWSSIILIITDYKISKLRKENILKYIFPHILLVSFIIISTKFFGKIVSKY